MTTQTSTATYSPAEIFEKGSILTVEAARQLRGKRIAATSAEYHMNNSYVEVFTVGEIISEWDDAARRAYPDGGFSNYQEYWASYMTEPSIDERKTNLILFSEDGKRKYVAHTKYSNYYSEPVFTGSDADREVFFIEL